MITLREVLDRAERCFPTNTAVVPLAGGPGVTWAEFVGRVRRAAGALRSLGVGAGDRFAVICRNDPRQAELIHAGYWMGAVPVPINYRLAPVEIADILDGIRPRLLAVEDHWASLAAELASTGHREPLLWIGFGSNNRAGEPDYETLRDASAEDDGHDSGPDDDALLLFTGGTTGRSKGVRLTHGNIAANGLQLIGPYGASEDDVMLHVAPMFHSADLLATPLSLLGGAHAYLPDFTPAAFLGAIETTRATFTLLTPTLLIHIIRSGRLGNFDISSLRRITYGSAPMDPAWIRRTAEAFPEVELVHSYGLTETSPILTTLGWNQHLAGFEGGDRLRSVGRPVIGVELRIADDEGNQLPAGAAGEIVVRGPNVSGGYLDRPEETAAVYRDGWFHTGDVGRLDDEGYLYLLDRKKDVIITGGENVWSAEVEAALYAHADVIEAAVIGVPDEVWGQAVLAVIVAAPGSRLVSEDGPDALIAHCRRLIGGYKVPRQFRFIEAMPKSAMGKILKSDLRRRYRSGALRG